MLVGRVSVVIVVFSGAVVSVTAIRICSSWVSVYNERKA